MKRALFRWGFSRFYRWLWNFLVLQVTVSILGFMAEPGGGIWLSLWFVAAVFWLAGSLSLICSKYSLIFGTDYFSGLKLAPWTVKLAAFFSTTLLFVLCAWPLFK